MKQKAFQWTRTLFLFTVLLLVVFGMGSLLRIAGNPDQTILYAFYAAAMFGDAALMAICAWLLNRRSRYVFFVSVFVLTLNIFLTIFDQFGAMDLLYVLLNLLTLIFLIQARKEFLPI